MQIALILGILNPIESPRTVIGWDKEAVIIQKVASDYGLDEWQTKLLVALRRTQNGGAGHEWGIFSDMPDHPSHRFKNDPAASVKLQCSYAAGTIKKRCPDVRNLESFMARYTPSNWKQELANIKSIMEIK